MKSLDGYSRSAKYEMLDRPLKQAISWIELKKKGELVQSVTVPESLRIEKLYLGDFGLEMKLGDPKPAGRPPMVYCSPDELHGKDPSLASDMWSYMVVFAHLYLGFIPFPTGLEGGVITGMVKCLGPLPVSWKGTYTDTGKAADFWYDPNTKSDETFSFSSILMKYCSNVNAVE